MEKISNEQTEVTTQATVVEEEKGVKEKTEVSLGKFKDVNALLNAYNSLQAEFTKRCQKLKELEGSHNVEQAPASADVGGEEKTQNNDTSKDKEQILKDYLMGVVNSKQQAVILDGVGVGVISPVSKPKSITEAGNLAKQILK